MRIILSAVAVCAVLAAPRQADAAIQYNVGVTPTFFNGTGNTNAGFAVDTANGIELGLRAQTRYPAPDDSPGGIMHQGNGVYGAFATGNFGPGGVRASWNFNWSINIGTGPLDALTYVLGIDYDPSNGTNFLTFDPINSGISVDHAFGNNSTTDATDSNAVPDGLTYAQRIANPNYNVAQNSWNLAFFDILTPLSFDPTADATYDIYLQAYRSGVLLAETEIQVIVGAGGSDVVPEPGALLAWGGLACCGGWFAWRAKGRG